MPHWYASGRKGGARIEMPSSRYYRVQARILLGWARVASDPELAERLRGRARELLAAANVTDEGANGAFLRSLAEFNDRQMLDPPERSIAESSQPEPDRDRPPNCPD